MLKTMGKLSLVASLLVAAQSVTAAVIPVDLSGWASEGSGNWTVAGDNNSVFQSQNGQPTVFFEPGTTSQGEALSGQITVETTGDDVVADGDDCTDDEGADADGEAACGCQRFG